MAHCWLVEGLKNNGRCQGCCVLSLCICGVGFGRVRAVVDRGFASEVVDGFMHACMGCCERVPRGKGIAGCKIEEVWDCRVFLRGAWDGLGNAEGCHVLHVEWRVCA